MACLFQTGANIPHLFPHFSAYKGEWLWPHFTPREVCCKHCGELYLDESVMDALEELREAWGKPIIINSAHRCVEHNAAVGGSPTSQHLNIAFDCVCPAPEQHAFCEAARKAGFHGIGRYPSRGFVHIDTRPNKAEWAR